MIETVAILNEKVQIELTKKNKLISLISLIIGAIGLVAFVVISTIFEDKIFGLLLLFAFPFTLGLISYISINKNIKNFKLHNIINNYEFNEDHFIVKSFKGNDQIGMSKINYNEVFKLKETETFIFIFANRVSAYPIIKTTLSKEDLNKIKQLINNAKPEPKNKNIESSK